MNKVVHHDDVARRGLWDQDLLDIEFENLAVLRPVDDEGGDHAGVAQAGDEGGGLPMSMRDAHGQTLSARRPAIAAGHVGASMNTSRSGSRSSCRSNDAWRRFTTSGRSCSLACAVFFSA
jgi:hypothetical protein